MVMGNPLMIAYRLILDDVPPPDPTRPELLLSLRPNPGNFMLITKEVSRNTSLVGIRVCFRKYVMIAIIICFFIHPAGK